MKHIFFFSPLQVSVALLCLSFQSFSQPVEIKIPVWVTSNSLCKAETLYFGVTTSSGLKTLSPGDSSCNGFHWCSGWAMDLHQYRNPSQVDTFCFEVAGAIFPFVFHWQPDLSLFYDSVSLCDGFGLGFDLIKANMLQVDSFKVTNTILENFWIVTSGPHIPVYVKDYTSEIPFQFNLQQNYPNPFNPKTIIRYRLSIAGYVSLKVFDLFGREVSELDNGSKPPGEYKIQWNADDLPSGVYFYRLQTADVTSVRKMILTR